MTDGAALPLALSDLVATLRDRDLVDTTITCGHAFGGDHEAVSVFSALDDRPPRRRRRRRGRRDGSRHRRHRHPRSASPASRSGRCSTRPPGSAGDPIAVPAGVLRRRARAGTRASRTTRSPRCASAPAAGSPSRCPRVGGDRRGRIRTPISTRPGIAARHDLVDRRRRPTSSARSPPTTSAISSMGRPAADDPVLFECAAAAGVAAARLP